MADRNSDLYRWQRVSKPRVYSRSQRVTTDDDVQSWIKKVEAASDTAAAQTFGTKPTNHRDIGRERAKSQVDNVRIHEAAYVEAQELLQQWVTEKLDFDTEMEYSEEAWTQKTQAEIKKDWDHLLHNDEDEEEDYLAVDQFLENKKKKPPKEDSYSYLDKDLDEAVGEILQGMMEKEVVKDDFLQDLGFDDQKKHYDPTTKMKLRQQQVKENREKREKQLEQKRREQQARKEAQTKARLMLHKEEQVKLSRKKREEQDIQREMARIRKDMEEEKRREEERTAREKREREELAFKAQDELDRQKKVELMEELRTQRQLETRRQQVLAKMEEIKIRRRAHDMKTLQRCFSAWYGVVAERRLQQGKARAMADWRLLLRAFKAWHSYVRNKHLDQETLKYEQEMKERHKKEVRAKNHNSHRMRRKYFSAWQLYIAQNQLHKEHQQKQGVTKNKMAAFLEAAATGKLWSKDEREDVLRQSKSMEDLNEAKPVQDSAREKVDALFMEGPAVRRGSASGRSDMTSSRSEVNTRSARSAGHRPGMPTQPWQLTKKHIKLVKTPSGDGKSHVEGGEAPKSSPNTKKAWEKKPFVVNNMENRHAAQQKILETQQNQIKEQQRLIEEMQYLQRQQLLQQKITNQQFIHQGEGGSVGQAAGEKMSQHLSNLQQSLVLNGNDKEAVDIENTARTESTLPQSTARTDISDTTVASGNTQLTMTTGVSRTSTTSKASNVTTNSKHLQFLKSMEGRQAERDKLKKEREEKKKKAEEERLARLEAEAQEKRQQEEEEKRKRIEAHRERKRLEKQREQEKQAQIEHIQHISALADQQHQRSLLKYRGWRPWCQLVELACRNRDRAERHFQKVLCRKVLLSWHNTVQSEIQHKYQLADNMGQYILLNRCFNNWKKLGEIQQIQEEKAQRHYQRHLQHKVIQAWADRAADEKIAMWHKERWATEHNTKRVVKTCFRAWRRFPRFRVEEEMKVKRREEMRKKVQSLLPDFSGFAPERTSLDKSIVDL